MVASALGRNGFPLHTDIVGKIAVNSRRCEALLGDPTAANQVNDRQQDDRAQ